MDTLVFHYIGRAKRPLLEAVMRTCQIRSKVNMITNLTGPDTEMKPGFKARKLRVCGRGESLKHMDHARVARNILNKTRVILEFVMKLRALIADSLDAHYCCHCCV